MRYDDVYEHIGQIGTFQLCAAACLLLYCLFGLDPVTMIFVGGDMPHWCKVEQLANFSYDLQKYVAIPKDESGNYKQCEMFDIDYNRYTRTEFLNWNRTLVEMANTTTRPCYNWVFEQVVFVSTVVKKFNLVCDWSVYVPLVSTIYMAGGLIGGIVGGPLSDNFGRKPTILGLLTIKVLGCFMSTFSPDYVTLTAGRFLMGLGSIGCLNTCYVLIMEMVGPKYRSRIGGSVQVATSICFMYQPFIAYMNRTDMRYQAASLGPNLLILLIGLIISESPRWLICVGRYGDAQELFERIAVVNNVTLPAHFNTTSMESEESTTSSFFLVFRFPVMRVRTIICCYICFTANLLYFSLSLNTGSLPGDIYTNTLISASLEVPSIILCVALVDWRFLGRRFAIFTTFSMSAISCILAIPFVLLGIGIGQTALSIIGKAFAVMSYTAMFIFCSEIFPTEVRNAGMGLVQTFGSIANMAASFIGEPLVHLWRPLPYLVLGIFGLVAAFSCLFLPETIGHELQDTIEQAEKFRGGRARIISAENGRSYDSSVETVSSVSKDWSHTGPKYSAFVNDASTDTNKSSTSVGRRNRAFADSVSSDINKSSDRELNQVGRRNVAFADDTSFENSKSSADRELNQAGRRNRAFAGDESSDTNKSSMDKELNQVGRRNSYRAFADSIGLTPDFYKSSLDKELNQAGRRNRMFSDDVFSGTNGDMRGNQKPKEVSRRRKAFAEGVSPRTNGGVGRPSVDGVPKIEVFVVEDTPYVINGETEV